MFFYGQTCSLLSMKYPREVSNQFRILRPVNHYDYIGAIHILSSDNTDLNNYSKSLGSSYWNQIHVHHGDFMDLVMSGIIFFPRVNFLCYLLFRYPFHPCVTTVTRKKRPPQKNNKKQQQTNPTTPVILPKLQVAGYS